MAATNGIARHTAVPVRKNGGTKRCKQPPQASLADGGIGGDGGQPAVRLTGILVEDGCVLLVEEVLRERSHWNLPGGRLEHGETLRTCLEREMREETGLDVEVGDLLYVTDRFKRLGNHIVDLSFAVRRTCPWRPLGQTDARDGETLRRVRMVPVDDLPAYGMGERLAELIRRGFPDRGSYQGDFHQLYGQ